MKFPLISLAIFIVTLTTSCVQKQQVDLIITNGNIYTVNDNFEKAEAIAISNGKIIAVSTSEEIHKNYKSAKKIDVKGKTIIPGLINSYCNFYKLGLSMQNIDLTGTKSFEEVIQRLLIFKNEKNGDLIAGNGWNQNDWENKELPTKARLDKLFPNIPVVLNHQEGDIILLNQAALDLAKIDKNTIVDGGKIIKKQDKLTGLLIGNAKVLVKKITRTPKLNTSVQALKDAENYCLTVGFTTIDEAGLDNEIIDLIDSLQIMGELKIRIYAMINANEKNLNYYLKRGTFKSDRLNVNSFKVFADGALGARNALLKESYSDRDNYIGGLITDPDSIILTAHRIINSNFQMNTYAIGDSANAFILKTYANAIKSQTNRRWRIEHAQVISKEDLDYFTEIIPSIQPTHALSDLYSPKDRLGSERIKGAFAYKKLLEINGRIALGTDFTDENLDPMYTFYAAVARKDLSGYPKDGFEIENSLTREETLKGMTIWAAYANFEEEEKGSIEVGKFADFIILNQNLMEVKIEDVPNTKVLKTFVNGELVSMSN